MRQWSRFLRKKMQLLSSHQTVGMPVLKQGWSKFVYFSYLFIFFVYLPAHKFIQYRRATADTLKN
jgi:hypothetical protein